MPWKRKLRVGREKYEARGDGGVQKPATVAVLSAEVQNPTVPISMSAEVSKVFTVSPSLKRVIRERWRRPCFIFCSYLGMHSCR